MELSAGSRRKGSWWRATAVVSAIGLVMGVMGAVGIAASSGPSTATGKSDAPVKADEAQIKEAYGKLPLSFEANAGQSDPDVDFLSRGAGYSLFLTPTEAVMSLDKKSSDGISNLEQAVIRMQLLDSNPSASPTSHNPLEGKVNYLVGDRSQWRTGISTFGAVAYQGVYPGIDVKYHGTQGRMEYDFIVAPGADPGVIRMNMAGADSISLDANGDLVMTTNGGELRQHKPVIFQEIAGERRPVPGDFVLRGSSEVAFEVGAYDTAAPLVIDPVLAYSTYLGGTANDFGFGIAVDSFGAAYLGGQTGSAVMPRGGAGDPAPKGTSPFAVQPTYGGGPSDAFVIKLNPKGTTLRYATYLGGARADAGFDLAIDAQGNAYLGGSTDSADDPGTTAVEAGFPTTTGAGQPIAAYDSTCGTDGLCNQVLPVNFFADACDPLEPACNPADPTSPGYLTAVCPPATFPTGCSTPAGNADNFLSKINDDGDVLLYSTYYGGAGAEQNAEEVPYAGQLGIDVFGSNAYLTSTTFASDFPTTANAFQTTCASCDEGNNDAYLIVIDTAVDGAAGLKYSTFVGGNGFDEGKAVAVDNGGFAYITGTITGVDPTPGSTTFPVKNPLVVPGGLASGAFDGSAYHGGYSDAYLTKVNPFWVGTGTGSLRWSNFVGGGGKEEGWNVAEDNHKDRKGVVMTGYTTSGPNPNPQVADPAHPGACAGGPAPFCDWASDPAPYFPITAGAHDTTYGGRAATDSGSSLFLDGDAFVTKFTADGKSLGYSTYLGGPSAEYGQGLAVDLDGHVYVAGWTTCRSQDPPGDVGPPPQFDPDGIPTGRNPGEPAQTGVGDCPTGFPTVNAPPGLDTLNTFNLGFETHNSPTAIFVTKLLPDASGVVYSVLLDGRGFDRGFALAVRHIRQAGGDISEAYVTGRTGSAPDFPLTPGSYDTTYNGAGRDAFISKLVG